jgi:TRAP-type uncharacterized transport system fused permease subunit
MKTFVPIIVTALLAACVFYTAVRIEVLNTQAGYYLPRQDKNPDGSFLDGKWRVSMNNSPRDQLREIVESFGLMQYLLAPILLILSVFVIARSNPLWAKIIASVSLLVSVATIYLAFYREYWSSLG